MARPKGTAYFLTALRRGRFGYFEPVLEPTIPGTTESEPRPSSVWRQGRYYTLLVRSPTAAISFYSYDENPRVIYADAINFSHRVTRVRSPGRRTLIAMMPALDEGHYRLWLGETVSKWPGHRYYRFDFRSFMIDHSLGVLSDHFGAEDVVVYDPKTQHERRFNIYETTVPVEAR